MAIVCVTQTIDKLNQANAQIIALLSKAPLNDFVKTYQFVDNTTFKLCYDNQYSLVTPTPPDPTPVGLTLEQILEILTPVAIKGIFVIVIWVFFHGFFTLLARSSE